MWLLPMMTSPMTDKKSDGLAIRDDQGRFLTGQSGNPAGRPTGTKNKIVQLKQDLELAVRENVKIEDIQEIISAMVKEAKAGSIGAAKLILDKTVSNAKDPEDPDAGSGGIRVVIENFTVNQAMDQLPKPPIEGEKVVNQEDTNVQEK